MMTETKTNPNPNGHQGEPDSMVLAAIKSGGQMVEIDGEPSAVPAWLDLLGGRFCKVYPKDKKPVGDGWQNTPMRWADLKQHVKQGSNIGMICGQHSGGIMLLDIDQDLPRFLETFPGWVSYPRIERGDPDKAKFIIRLLGDWDGHKKYKRTPQDKHPFLEVLTTGNQGVMPPSIHPSGEPYTGINTGGNIPELTPDALRAVVATWAEIQQAPAPASIPEPPERPQDDTNDLRAKVKAYWQPLRVFEHFGLTSNSTVKERDNIRVLGNGGLLCTASGKGWARPGDGPEAGGDCFDAWHFCETGQTEYKVPNSQFRAVLLRMAAAANIPVPTTTRPQPAQPDQGGEPDQFFIATCLGRSETGDAELFNALYQNKVKFDRTEKRFYTWGGLRWEIDTAGAVVGMVQNGVAAAFLEAGAKVRKAASDREAVELADKFHKRGKELLSRKRIVNVLDLTGSQPDIRLLGNEWDLSPMLLPVQNGLIDLKTGQFRAARPADIIRDCAPVDWKGINEPAPTWGKTLLEIFGGDADLVDFIGRLFGYSITGQTKEQVLPILYGDGANGKSTILAVLAEVLGAAFSGPTNPDALMESKNSDGNAASPYIYSMRGKRLIWASESKEGQKLNAGLVKQLTGDSLITARPLHGNPVTFKQTHKLLLITNHLPRIPDGDDYAIWRRVLRIPFDTRFVAKPKAANERTINPSLPDELKREYPGVMAWLVKGCLDWQQQGLNPPAAVLEATEKYRDDEDLVGQYADERLIIRPDLEVMASQIYKDYVTWCDTYNYRPMSNKALAQRLKRKFGEPTRKKTGIFYQGISILV